MSIRYAKAEIVRVVDGDTVHTNLDIGWGIILRPRIGKEYNFGTLRIVFPDGKGYDCPERGTELNRRAMQYLAETVKPGQILHVISHGIATDGRRTAASVTFEDGRDWATTLAGWGYTK